MEADVFCVSKLPGYEMFDPGFDDAFLLREGRTLYEPASARVRHND